jgi:hypothetical protein
MRHQNRTIEIAQDMPCGSTKYHFRKPAVTISAKHNKIGPVIVGCAQQRFTDRLVVLHHIRDFSFYAMAIQCFDNACSR